MRRTRHALRLLAWLALVAFALPLLVGSQALFFCRMSGQVMSACCCSGREPARRPTTAELMRGDCCQRLSQAVPAPPSRIASASTAVAPAALFTVLPRFELARRAPRRLVRASIFARGPPREGPPLYLENSVWLI